MCILCVIQKWSRRIATMLPWLVIPLIGLWALSQLLPPAFRFEITSPRLACVFVLLVTLFWYEILMPQLSTWRVRRNARLRERKRTEAIEMHKLRKTATRKCRNCLTPYRDQNPGGGGKFMCSYCGHISKRPVLDLPVPPGGNSGILKDLVGKGEKILNGKAWSDGGWMCSREWLENGNWDAGPFAGRQSYLRKNGGGFFDHCSTEKSYSRVFIFACKAFRAIFFSVFWLCRKVFRIRSSEVDASGDAEHMMLDKLDENGGNGQESRGEKARRKAEEKRQARLERELLEEEERKQREEVARLVEERRRSRDEKTEAEKERGKGSPRAKERDVKKEAERKRQERKKERDRGSSISNSDAEELEKRSLGKESERSKRTEVDKSGLGLKGSTTSSHNRVNSGTRYFDRVRGTFLSSSRAFTGSGFFGKSASPQSSAVSREHKVNNTLVDHAQTASIHRKEVVVVQSGRANVNGDDKSVNRTVLVEPQPCPPPKKSWQQLFTRSSSSVSPPSNPNVITRPNGKSPQSEVPFSTSFEKPINFGLSSPFTPPSLSFESTTTSLSLSSESIFPKIGETPQPQPSPHMFLHEPSEIFEDPCYEPDSCFDSQDPLALLGPVSELINNFQLDRDFAVKTKSAVNSEVVTKPSPIESPLSRSRNSEEKQASSLVLPSRNHDDYETGSWHMWNTPPILEDALDLVSGTGNWILPNDLNKKDIGHQANRTLSPNVSFGNCQNGSSMFNNSVPTSDGLWLAKNLFGRRNENLIKPEEEVAAQNGLVNGYPSGPSTPNSWAKQDWSVPVSRDGVGSSPLHRPPHIGGLYSSPDEQSVWSYD